jgi:hypothetical protein
VNSEIYAFIIALMEAFTGPRNARGHERFARAIMAATDDPQEQRLLTVVAYGENWYHETSYPPFGLTDLIRDNPSWCLTREGDQPPEPGQTRRDRPHCRVLTIEEGARISLRALRFVRRVRCAPGASDEAVLGRYGWGGACVARPLTSRRMGRARRVWPIPAH